jgi:hypothetical protein
MDRHPGPPDGASRPHDAPSLQPVQGIKRLARITGLLYLVVAVFGMFAGTVSTSLIQAGDAATTADNILASQALVRGSLVAWIIVLFADVAVAVTFFVLLRAVSPTISLLAAAFRVVYAAVQGINLLNLFNALFVVTNANYGAGFDRGEVNALALFSLGAFGTGFRIGLLFFGIHLFALGYVLVASRYIPRVIGGLVVLAGIGYFADSLGRLLVPDYSAVATAVLLTLAAFCEIALVVWLLAKGVEVRRPASPTIGTS